jgi:hypothetical protein
MAQPAHTVQENAESPRLGWLGIRLPGTCKQPGRFPKTLVVRDCVGGCGGVGMEVR